MGNSRRSRVPDGIFAGDERVLRLYPDGTALHVIIKPAPGVDEGARIATWLRKGNHLDGVRETPYARNGDRVTLSTTDPISGLPMEITGTSRGDELTLDLKMPGRQLRGVTFYRIWPPPKPGTT